MDVVWRKVNVQRLALTANEKCSKLADRRGFRRQNMSVKNQAVWSAESFGPDAEAVIDVALHAAQGSGGRGATEVGEIQKDGG